MSGAQVTVVIPAFRAEATVAAAVRSARAAGAGRVLVVDDGSDDSTAAAAWGAGAEVVLQENAGANAARWAGLDRVGSPYVILLDADDALAPAAVAAGVAALERAPGAVGALGGVIGVAADGAQKRLGPLPPEVSARWLVERGFAPRPPLGVMWRTTALRRARSRADVPWLGVAYAEDYELMVRAALAGPLVSHDAVVAHYSLEGGRSDAAQQELATAGMRVAHHYAPVVGSRAPSPSPRRVRAMLLLRRATARPRFVHRRDSWADLARAAILAPGCVGRWAARSIAVRV